MKERTVRIEFTARQVVIVVSLIVLAAVLVPVGVHAATGSAVNITDPTSAGKKAKVDGFGDLRTVVCDPGVNRCGGIDTNSGLKVSTAPPASRLHQYTVHVGNTYQGLFGSGVFAAGTKVAIDSITVTNPNGSPDWVGVYRYYGLGATCNTTGTFGGYQVDIAIPANSTAHLAFPIPMIYTAGTSWCFVSQLGSGTSVGITTVGHIL